MLRLIGILLLVAAAALAAHTAAAHAMLLESVPADGAVLAQPPPEILLRFSEPVTPIKIEVLDSAGKIVTGGRKPVGQDSELRLALLPSGLPDGTYLLNYRRRELFGLAVLGLLAAMLGIGIDRGIADRCHGVRFAEPQPLAARRSDEPWF